MAELDRTAVGSKLRSRSNPSSQPDASALKPKPRSAQPVSFRLQERDRQRLARLIETAEKGTGGRVYNVDMICAALLIAEQQSEKALLKALRDAKYPSD